MACSLEKLTASDSTESLSVNADVRAIVGWDERERSQHNGLQSGRLLPIFKSRCVVDWGAVCASCSRYALNLDLHPKCRSIGSVPFPSTPLS